jgi:HEAT repeat protein
VGLPPSSGRNPRIARILPGAVRALTLAVALLGATPTAGAFVWPNVPDQVARSLASSDVSERRLAAQRLAELPAELATKLVRKAVNDPDVEVRLRVAQAAVLLRISKAGDLVVGWLGEGDARLRLAACDVIRVTPTERSVVALGRVLGDPDAHVRQAAAAAMGGSGIADAVSPLLGHIDDQAPEVRGEVVRALGRIGDARAVVPLIGKVQDSVSDVRKAACRALGELGDKRAVSALMLAIQDGVHDVRVEALGALGKLRSDEATVAIAPLVDPDPTPEPQLGTALVGGPRSPSASAALGIVEVRSAALRALGRIGSDAAVKALIGALAKDDPNAARSPVREALVSAGKNAVPGLTAALAGSPSPNMAAGAALALGELGAKDALEVLVRGMQRGVVPLRIGLRALARIGSPAALPTVLEMLDDADPSVRKEAIRAATALLDPAKIDGRAVDPASHALSDSATPSDEKIELVRLLGKTGAPRAQAVLLSLASTKSPPLRLAVLEALGTLKSTSPEVDRTLLKGLDDESADVRLKAALALSNVAGPSAAAALLERLAVAAEQDRGALGIALSGALSRSNDAALAERVGASIGIAPDVARDALIEGLGRMKGAAAGRELAKLGSGSIDDRRKAAEALAGHAETIASLLTLAADPDPGVRANAVWSLGVVGRKEHAPAVAALIRDPDVAVAGNAAAALGRIAARDAQPTIASPPLCTALADARPYVRANALEALSLAGTRCDAPVARDVLARDPSEAARLAAADYVARASHRAGAPSAEVEADRRALSRCASDDKNASVALRCARLALPTTAKESDDVSVFVVPDGKNTPQARAPFALLRPDGLLRLGIADRRGELFEFAAPRGMLRLVVPAALAK